MRRSSRATMEPARGRRLGWLCVLAPLFGLPAGCGLVEPHLDQAPLTSKLPTGGPQRLAEAHAVRVPDILEIRIDRHPAVSRPRPPSVEGRLEAGPPPPGCAAGAKGGGS